MTALSHRDRLRAMQGYAGAFALLTSELGDVRDRWHVAGLGADSLNGDGPGFTGLCPSCLDAITVKPSESGRTLDFACLNGCDDNSVAEALHERTARLVQPVEQAPTGLQPRKADAARVRPFRWAWQSRVLIGYINLLVGDEGVGKGTFLAWLAARLTRGDLPGDYLGHPVKVLIVGDEDGFDGIWTPRLLAANADLDLVLDLPAGADGDVVLSRDDAALRKVIADHDVKVVIFDQLLDNLGVAVDDWRGKQVRHAITPARRIAADLGIVILGALHTNKSRTGSFRDRLSGTQQFNALSRSSLLLAEHPDDPERRVLARGKGNYSKTPRSIEFTIESRTVNVNGYAIPVGGVAGVTESDLTITDVLREPAKTLTKADQGRQLITDELADGEWHQAADVLAVLGEAGIADREARRLATDLGVDKRKSSGYPAHAEWRLSRGGLPVYLSSRSSQSEEATPARPATPVDRQARTDVDRTDAELLDLADRLIADHPEAV